MRAAPLISLLLLSTVASPAHPQAVECIGFSGNAGRVCTAAVDATRAFHPVLGGLVSGGNPILGNGGPLGGLGHVTVSARVNAVEIVLPDLSYDGSGTTVPVGQKVFTPAPQLEAAVGVYGGLPSGLLAIDALGSAQLLPTTAIDNFTVDQDSRRIGDVALGLGYGARLGILRDTGPTPGISVSAMRRDIPTLTYGSVGSGDAFQYSADLHATNLRLVIGKQLALLGLAAGVGWDKYTGSARIAVGTGGQTAATLPIRLEESRTMIFLDAGLGLAVLDLIGEVGYQTARGQRLTTDFEDLDTDKGTFYGGLGLRVGL
jgi:hypothetical protein